MHESIIALSQHIEKQLEGWTVRPLDDEFHQSYLYLDHENGLNLYLRSIWNAKERVSVSIGGYPKSAQGRDVGYKIATPGTMTAALSRTPGAILGDIQRKLIRPGFAALERYRVEVRTRNAADAEIKHAENLISSIEGLRFVDHAGEWYGPNIRIRLDSRNSCHIQIENAPPELAVIVARFAPP